MALSRNNQIHFFCRVFRFRPWIRPCPACRAKAQINLCVIGFLFVLSFFSGTGLFSIPAIASEKTALTDNIIGSTFKVLAKTFISSVDMERIKKDNIERITKMDEVKFRNRYAKIYNVIENCPSLKSYCGLEKEATRQQVTAKIRSLDKKKAYEMLDLIPNSFIASQFRAYLREKKEEICASKITGQIQSLWNRIISNIRPKKIQADKAR